MTGQYQSQNANVLALSEVIPKVREKFLQMQEYLHQYETKVRLQDSLLSAHFNHLNLSDNEAEETRSSLRQMVEENDFKTFMNLKNVVKSKLEYLKTLKL